MILWAARAEVRGQGLWTIHRPVHLDMFECCWEASVPQTSFYIPLNLSKDQNVLRMKKKKSESRAIILYILYIYSHIITTAYVFTLK